METAQILKWKTITLMYHGLIKPHLLYAILIWGSTCSTYINRLQSITKPCCSNYCWLPQTTAYLACLP